MLKKKKTIGIAFAAVFLFGIALILYSAFFPKETTDEFFAMNTYIKSSAVGKDSAVACEKIHTIVNSLDADVLSRQNKNSELAIINSSGGKMSEKMRKYVYEMLEIYNSSNGAFDFALGAVSDLWDFGNAPHLPDEAEIKQALEGSGVNRLSINGDEISTNGAIIDFGASGKGIALDEAKELLSSMKIKNAVISVGGSILLYGDKTFTVGIRNPEGSSGSYVMTVSTPAACISTSGSYEQSFEEGGRVYHHILNPKTGYPVDNGLVSVTVLSDSGLLSDALSTACFVIGVEDGMRLAEKYGCEAVFIDSNKNVTASKGIKNSLKITDSSYSFAE